MPDGGLREALSGWWDGPLPERSDFGARYPWQQVRAHAVSRSFRGRVEAAVRILDAASAISLKWNLCLSGGKDSTACALLLRQVGWSLPAVSARDSFCWPGEELYLTQISESCRLPLRRVLVPQDLVAIACSTPAALTTSVESRSGVVSRHWYRALDEDERINGVTGKIWGIRSAESRNRHRVRTTKGTLYERIDGMTICAPISDWSALDVHTMLARSGIPVHPVYACVDPGVNMLDIRHSWWVYAGAGMHQHYTWLRRWWPHLWERAVQIDPAVAEIS